MGFKRGSHIVGIFLSTLFAVLNAPRARGGVHLPFHKRTPTPALPENHRALKRHEHAGPYTPEQVRPSRWLQTTGHVYLSLVPGLKRLTLMNMFM